MGIDSRTISSPKAVKTGKSPEIRGTAKIGTAFAMQSASARGDARSQRERQKMDSETTNLFRRRDTFFGICEAVGQDFGFNPLFLRLAFIAPLFFFPSHPLDRKIAVYGKSVSVR